MNSAAQPDANADLLRRAQLVSPGGVNSISRRIPYPIVITRAHGSRAWDANGREFVDFHGAWGAIALGHSHPTVTQAVVDRASTLVLTGITTTPDEVELAERIVRHIPSADQVHLVSVGSDATYHAIRLSRAITNRECIVKFGSNFHGAHDYAFRSANPDHTTDGILDAAARTVLTCRYNDLDQVEGLFRQRGHEIAALIVEPIAHNANLLPEPGFLAGLRRITAEHEALLIFDEIITGFRYHLGGYQSLVGVTPDLTTLGKAIGNGYPIAAVAGPERYMSRFATHPDGTVPLAGTYNGNAIAAAAANATLAVMEHEPVHAHLCRLGDRMRAGLQQIADDCDVQAVATGHGPIYNLLITDSLPKSHEDMASLDTGLFIRYRIELLKRGILEMPLACVRAQLTYAHTDDDVDRALGIHRDALLAARESVATSR